MLSSFGALYILICVLLARHPMTSFYHVQCFAPIWGYYHYGFWWTILIIHTEYEKSECWFETLICDNSLIPKSKYWVKISLKPLGCLQLVTTLKCGLPAATMNAPATSQKHLASWPFSIEACQPTTGIGSISPSPAWPQPPMCQQITGNHLWELCNKSSIIPRPHWRRK